MTKNTFIGMLIFLLILQTMFARARENARDHHVAMWKMSYERERDEVFRQQEVMISFGLPVFVIDPNDPLKVIPK